MNKHPDAQHQLTNARRAVGSSHYRLLAEQQTALRRVATLVARGVSPSEVFAAVVDGMVNCLHVENVNLLRPALKALARRCPIPANVDVQVERRLPDSIEVAAYYVVAEALTNAAKYPTPPG